MNTNSFGSKFSHKAPLVNIVRFSSSKNKLHKKISEKKVKKMSQLLVPTTKMVAVVTKKSESLQTEGRHFRSMICKINDV